MDFILNDMSMFENILIPMHMVCGSSVLEHQFCEFFPMLYFWHDCTLKLTLSLKVFQVKPLLSCA